MTNTTAAPKSRKAVKNTKAGRKNRKTAVKLVASVALVAGAASVAGLGTFGAFTSTTSATESVAAGTLVLGQGTATQGPSIAAAGLVPGDTVERDVVLTRGANDEKFGTVSLTTTAATSNLLSTDTTNGLQISVDQCPTAWVKVDANKTNGALRCNGATPTQVLAPRPVVGANLALPIATGTLNDTKVSNLRVTLKFPVDADNRFQGLANTIGLTFDATQRANENR
ncbi:TasA family protein [Nocardioides abyssi]|uniref:TasA family protein n=1 Tax=Nocardioides abyssi TaxID=3058370 RepID=A0ABT8EYD2_9ACTN|nr:TasA family protein [Nocardioides abyssi]MDN4163157.1 TasA family protein [Nocardioides abyssi]